MLEGRRALNGYGVSRDWYSRISILVENTMPGGPGETISIVVLCSYYI